MSPTRFHYATLLEILLFHRILINQILKRSKFCRQFEFYGFLMLNNILLNQIQMNIHLMYCPNIFGLLYFKLFVYQILQNYSTKIIKFMTKKQTITTQNQQPEQHPKTKLNRFDTKLSNTQTQPTQEIKTWKTSAVIYIGHLPYGFFEEQLKRYFSQYGDVLAVKLCRSKKTGRSKGYGFIQFRYPEVAQIAAEAMNNYLILGKILVCKTLEGNRKNPFLFKQMRSKTKFINWKKIYILQKNKKRTKEELKIEVQNLLVHEEQRRNRLKSLGINYNFSGYSEILKK